LLFLQAAGTGPERAHQLVDAVSETFRAAIEISQPATGDVSGPGRHGRSSPDPSRLEKRLAELGCDMPDRALVVLAVDTTLAAPAREHDARRIAAATTALANPERMLEVAGVVFGFNLVNRVADARRVKLEFRWLRELKPIRGRVERGFASLTKLFYDLSEIEHPRYTAHESLCRLEALFQQRGAPGVPDALRVLEPAPRVLEGILEILAASCTAARVRSDFWIETAAIATASLAPTRSSLRQAIDAWLDRASLPDTDWLLARASADDQDPDLVATIRRYAWKTANAAYTITSQEVAGLRGLGLSDPEVLDLTLAASLFSALAITEPLIQAADCVESPRDRPQAATASTSGSAPRHL
jgi:hypothetical protein